jgi:PGF-pre-PGF domain-containing protein
MIRNYSNSSENLNISVFLDIPISSNSTDNRLNTSTGIGSFGGSGAKMATNATTYQSFYFNTTEVSSATSVAIGLSGWTSTQDIDLFLFDNSSSLKAKSINKNTSEWLVYNYLPSSAWWEIRLYGNSTNVSGIPYTGSIVFSTLNLTNTSDPGQQISSINFGSNLNVSNTSSVNLTLKNEGNINYTGIAETKELYYVKEFGGNNSSNFTFLVPNSSIVSKVKASLNWTGASNYSFDVYKPDGTKTMISLNKYPYANVSNAIQEEYNETDSIPSTAGFWRVEVKNNTNITNPYNITIYEYVNASKWITSNFLSSGVSLNSTGISNYTYNFTVSLTVQNDTLDGTYEGYLQYRANSGATLRIPIEATAKTGILIINNTLGSSEVRVDEDIGANITRVLNITYNNTGNYTLTFTNTSTGRLNLTTNSSKYITFTYSSPSNFAAGSSGTINITIPINTSLTEDAQGVYQGSIFFTTDDAHPYQNFNLTIKVNLTSLLDVRFYSISSPVNTASNTTAKLTINYLNGTSLESPGNMTRNNFTSVWLSSLNVSYEIPTSGLRNLSVDNGTNPIYQSSDNTYGINISIPSNQAGGIYSMYVMANYTRSDGKAFGGLGISGDQEKYLIINSSGLYMTSNQTSFSLYSGNTTTIFVNITNYGPVTSNAIINNISISRGSCSEYTISKPSTFTTCSPAATYNDTVYNLTVPGNGSCLVWWTITGGSGSDSSCSSGSITGRGFWYNPSGLSFSILVHNTTTTTTTTIPGNTGDTTSNTPVENETKTIASVAAGKNATFNFTKETLKVLNVTINAKNALSSISVTVKEGSKPSGASDPSGVVFKYLSIVKSGFFDTDVNSAYINFKIDKSWVSTEKINSSTIVLQRYYGEKWNKLTTMKTGEDSDSLYFQATSPGLSIFVITGEKSSDTTLPIWSSNSTNSTSAGNPVEFRLKWIDNIGLSGYIFSISNGTGNFVNDSLVSFSGTENWSNVTKVVNSTVGTRIQWLVYAKDTNNNWIKSDVFSFTTTEKGAMPWLTYVLVGVGIAVAIILAYLFWPTKLGDKISEKIKPKEFKYKSKTELKLKLPEMEKTDIWKKLRDRWSKISKKK